MRTRFPDPAVAWNDDEARLVLDEWRRTGGSIAAFARQRGVTAARLYWWKKRLAATPAAAPAPTVSLVPASIITEGAALMIRLPGGVAIEIANASPSWVATVVAELTRPLP